MMRNLVIFKSHRGVVSANRSGDTMGQSKTSVDSWLTSHCKPINYD